MNARLDVAEQVMTCTACDLHAKCNGPVPFRGPTPALVAVVGEAPGRQEDRHGKPFIGRAGQMITKHLTTSGIDPEQVFICNTASCFPDGTPTAKQVAACRPNKVAQLELADPQFVLLLGKVALRAEREDLAENFGRARGRPFRPTPAGPVYFSTYHPAYALRSRVGEMQMAEDLATFGRLVTAPNWAEFIGDTCWQCSYEWVLVDDTGIPFCEDHAPKQLKARLELARSRR